MYCSKLFSFYCTLLVCWLHNSYYKTFDNGRYNEKHSHDKLVHCNPIKSNIGGRCYFLSLQMEKCMPHMLFSIFTQVNLLVGIAECQPLGWHCGHCIKHKKMALTRTCHPIQSTRQNPDPNRPTRKQMTTINDQIMQDVTVRQLRSAGCLLCAVGHVICSLALAVSTYEPCPLLEWNGSSLACRCKIT